MILKQVSADGAVVLGGFFFFKRHFFPTFSNDKNERKVQINIVKYYDFLLDTVQLRETKIYTWKLVLFKVHSAGILTLRLRIW